MKRILVLTCTVLFTQLLFAQRFAVKRNEVVYGIGFANYMGELGGANQFGTNGIADFEITATRPSLELGLRRKLHRHGYIKGGITWGMIYGDDAKTQEIHRQNRNLHFRSQVLELAVLGEFFPIPEKYAHVYRMRGVGGLQSQFMRPYLFAGVAGFYFNPKAQVNRVGQWYALQQLSTEGQGIVDGKLKYSRVSFSIPMGFGIRYTMGRTTALNISWGLRKTFTDYLDDVSTEYVDPNIVREAYGDIAAELSDPQLGLLDYDPTKPGFQRGDPSDNDLYMFAMITLSYRFRGGRTNVPKF